MIRVVETMDAQTTDKSVNGIRSDPSPDTLIDRQRLRTI